MYAPLSYWSERDTWYPPRRRCALRSKTLSAWPRYSEVPMSTLSVRNVAACLGVSGKFSLWNDLAIFPDQPTHSLRQLLKSMQADCFPYVETSLLLDIDASSKIIDLRYDPTGFLHTFEFHVTIRNTTGYPVTITKSFLLLTGLWRRCA